MCSFSTIRFVAQSFQISVACHTGRAHFLLPPKILAVSASTRVGSPIRVSAGASSWRGKHAGCGVRGFTPWQLDDRVPLRAEVEHFRATCQNKRLGA